MIRSKLITFDMKNSVVNMYLCILNPDDKNGRHTCTVEITMSEEWGLISAFHAKATNTKREKSKYKKKKILLHILRTHISLSCQTLKFES